MGVRPGGVARGGARNNSNQSNGAKVHSESEADVGRRKEYRDQSPENVDSDEHDTHPLTNTRQS